MNKILTLALLIILSLTGCNVAKKDAAMPSNSVVDENTVINPTLVDGVYVISRKDFVHNYKVGIEENLCAKGKVGFPQIISSDPKVCTAAVKNLVNMCMASKFKDAIPEVLKSKQEIHTSGAMLGQCIIQAYMQTKGR